MDIKGLQKTSSVFLAIFLLLLLSFYLLIALLGYTFIPFNWLVLNVLFAGLIVLLTVGGVRNRNEKTKASVVFAVLLPLIAFAYIAVRLILLDISGEAVIINIIHACVTLSCSMVLFFSCVSGKRIKIGLGVLYSFLLLFVGIVLFLAVLTSDIPEDTVVKSEISPNAKYLAEIVSRNVGATGGATMVTVTRQNSDINIFIGELKKDPKIIYTGRWGEDERMTLQWGTNETLYINGIKYIIP